MKKLGELAIHLVVFPLFVVQTLAFPWLVASVFLGVPWPWEVL